MKTNIFKKDFNALNIKSMMPKKYSKEVIAEIERINSLIIAYAKLGKNAVSVDLMYEHDYYENLEIRGYYESRMFKAGFEKSYDDGKTYLNIYWA